MFVDVKYLPTKEIVVVKHTQSLLQSTFLFLNTRVDYVNYVGYLYSM